MLSLSFDDARLTQTEAGIPLFRRYGVKATFYVSLDQVRKNLSTWREVVRAGHEIGNHSLRHAGSGNFKWSRDNPIENYTLERMQDELRQANREIRELLGVTSTTFAYPCGHKFVGRGLATRSTVPLVAAMFAAGRGYMDETFNVPGYCDPAQLFGIPSDGRSFKETRQLLQEELDAGGCIVFAGHEIGAEPGMTQVAFLEELLTWAQDPAHPIWVNTVANVATYLRQPPDQK